MKREHLQIGLELVGAVLATYGVWLFSHSAAFVMAGIMLVIIAQAISRRRESE